METLNDGKLAASYWPKDASVNDNVGTGEHISVISQFPICGMLSCGQLLFPRRRFGRKSPFHSRIAGDFDVLPHCPI